MHFAQHPSGRDVVRAGSIGLPGKSLPRLIAGQLAARAAAATPLPIRAESTTLRFM